MLEKLLNVLVDDYDDKELEEDFEVQEEEMMELDEEDQMEQDQFIEDPGIIRMYGENNVNDHLPPSSHY
ncbi:hypothetical protein ERJ70_15110 [Sediminibacillus dalangtanensis]|uniref:Uncharacterized protein n=1 Tax=Sediminibacillus dalangtanensis TaxID=2729421 RepID=A0ABX7W0A9_9BACI|nr:hypothetical protein [Sediminibacillus dalangtanensis]QTN00512.1 hypothetical protein ERJ70_15110 [Sediminibacillus dalangtanensis]